MAVDRTHISWAESTWNPLRGCRHVSRGCAHCYAERIAARFSGQGQPYEGLATWHHGMPQWTGQVRLVEAVLEQPARWTTGRRIYVNSQSDLFYEGVADSDIHRIWEQMRSTPSQTFLVLTKRPERMWQWIEDWRWNRLPSSSPGWVIAGGESGPGFRPMHLAWLAAIVAQCQEADVPVFVKQDAAVRPGQQGRIPDRLWQCKAVPSGPPAGDL